MWARARLIALSRWLVRSLGGGSVEALVAAVPEGGGEALVPAVDADPAAPADEEVLAAAELAAVANRSVWAHPEALGAARLTLAAARTPTSAAKPADLLGAMEDATAKHEGALSEEVLARIEHGACAGLSRDRPCRLR